MLRVTAIREQLVCYATRLLGDGAEAEDVVQEALLALHHSNGVTRPDAWLQRVVKNRALDRLRVRRDTVAVDDLGDVEPPENEGTVVVASWMPVLVGSLPEPYATAVREVDLEGLSQAEFAARHGLSPSGARTRVQRGRALLHNALLACCPVRFEEGEVIDVGVVNCMATGCSNVG